MDTLTAAAHAERARSDRTRAHSRIAVVVHMIYKHTVCARTRGLCINTLCTLHDVCVCSWVAYLRTYRRMIRIKCVQLSRLCRDADLDVREDFAFAYESGLMV